MIIFAEKCHCFSQCFSHKILSKVLLEVAAFNKEKVLVGAFSEHIEYRINSMSKLLDSAGHRAELGHYVGGGWRGEEFFIELYKHEQGHWLAIVCHTIIK